MGRKAPSRVRIPPSPLPAPAWGRWLHSCIAAPVAQLDRASVYGTEGQRFESPRAPSKLLQARPFFVLGDGPSPHRVPTMSRDDADLGTRLSLRGRPWAGVAARSTGCWTVGRSIGRSGRRGGSEVGPRRLLHE